MKGEDEGQMRHEGNTDRQEQLREMCVAFTRDASAIFIELSEPELDSSLARYARTAIRDASEAAKYITGYGDIEGEPI